MYTFLVFLFDNDLEVEKVVVCRNKEDLAYLLFNLDDKYEIINDIQVIADELETNWRNFCKPLDDLNIKENL